MQTLKKTYFELRGPQKDFHMNHRIDLICDYYYTVEPRFSEPRLTDLWLLC